MLCHNPDNPNKELCDDEEIFYTNIPAPNCTDPDDINTDLAEDEIFYRTELAPSVEVGVYSHVFFFPESNHSCFLTARTGARQGRIKDCFFF